MVLVSRHPPLFRKAEDIRHHCGAWQLKAVAAAFGHEADLSDFFHSPAHYRRDWSLPWLMPRVLERYGIRSRLGFWKRRAFADNLASALGADMPAVFLINSIHGTGRWHWISAWGHDETAEEFLCYDSQVQTAFGTERGNIRYAGAFLASRLPFRGTFAITVGAR